jgi:hypothetical protein
MINVTFKTQNRSRKEGVLPDNCTLQQFRDLIERLFGKEALSWVYICKGKSFRIDDEALFNVQKHLITNGCVIHGCQRMPVYCLVPDTVISLSDGTKKVISEVQVGDTLLAFTASGEIVTTTVEKVAVRDTDKYVELYAGQTILRVTDEHPFFIGNGRFDAMKNLHINDCIYNLVNGSLQSMAITKMKIIDAPATRVYNLHTKEPHTFFANGIAVNDGPC